MYPTVVSDLTAAPPGRQWVSRAGSVMVAPVRTEAGLWAILEVWSDFRDAFTPQDVEVAGQGQRRPREEDPGGLRVRLRGQARRGRADPRRHHPPVVTPFREDGSLDLPAFEANLEPHTPPRTSTVTWSWARTARPRASRRTRSSPSCGPRAARAGSRALLVGTGLESTRATIALTRKVADLGADAALVLTPHYYKAQMTAEALRRHFEAVAEASPIPVLLYSVPPFTGLPLPARPAGQPGRSPQHRRHQGVERRHRPPRPGARFGAGTFPRACGSAPRPLSGAVPGGVGRRAGGGVLCAAPGGGPLSGFCAGDHAQRAPAPEGADAARHGGDQRARGGGLESGHGCSRGCMEASARSVAPLSASVARSSRVVLAEARRAPRAARWHDFRGRLGCAEGTKGPSGSSAVARGTSRLSAAGQLHSPPAVPSPAPALRRGGRHVLRPAEHGAARGEMAVAAKAADPPRKRRGAFARSKTRGASSKTTMSSSPSSRRASGAMTAPPPYCRPLTRRREGAALEASASASRRHSSGR